jgi:uncharacterized membrane protein (DUF4010 family)
MTVSLTFDEKVYRDLMAPAFKELKKKMYTDISLHLVVALLMLIMAFAAYILVEKSGYFMGLLFGSVFFALASLVSTPLTINRIKKKKSKLSGETE